MSGQEPEVIPGYTASDIVEIIMAPAGAPDGPYHDDALACNELIGRLGDDQRAAIETALDDYLGY
jgi:hypothetical protein